MATLKILVRRRYNKLASHYCIGDLIMFGKKFCDTIEPADYGLTKEMGEIEIKKIKLAHTEGPVAIPTGTYKVAMNVVSNKYSKSEFYQKLCGGKVPRITQIPGYDGVLIHAGNIAGLYGQTDTLGCLLVGNNSKPGMVTESKATLTKLYNVMKKYDTILITYTRTYNV